MSLLVLLSCTAFLLSLCLLPSLASPSSEWEAGASSPPPVPDAAVSRDDDLCQSLRPTLSIHKHLLPGPHLDSRARSVTVVVEWRMEVFWPLVSSSSSLHLLIFFLIDDRIAKEGDAWEECRYVVRVTDGVPAVPLRVPNELAQLFATTHNSSFVHREYAVSPIRSASSLAKHDSWNYTLHIQPVSLSPLSDVLQVVLPSPRLTLFSVAAGDDESVIGEATLASPAVLTLSLYYAPPSVSLHDALALSLVCVVLIVVCHFVVASRLNKTVKTREEGVKRKTETTTTPTKAEQPLAQTIVASGSDTLPSAVVDDTLSASTATLASPSDSSTSTSSPAAPFRFKARDTRKRFTRPQPSGGSLDY